MPDVFYSDRTISYTVQDCPDCKAHYISVSRDAGVVVKGPNLSTPQAERLVLKKARWIVAKLALVRIASAEPIVTGSRIPYLGRYYYTEVMFTAGLSQTHIDFNQSRFRIQVNPDGDVQAAIQEALIRFFRAKAVEKIAPRVRHWATRTGLDYNDLKFRQMEKRWGSCTPSNAIIINVDVVRLPYTLIDYVIVHELCHTKVKNHTNEFWAELAQHLINWKELDHRIKGYEL